MIKKYIGLIALIPPAIIFYLITKYGITLPLLDQFDFVPMLTKAYNHQLTFSELWTPINSHRMLLPLLYKINLALLTKWNIMAELLTNFTCSIIVFFCLWKMAMRTVKKNILPWALLIISCLLFSPGGWEAWGQGWQINVFFSLLASILAIFFISELPGKLKTTLLALAFTIISCLSYSYGLFTWVAVLLLIILKNENRRQQLITWCLSGAVFLAIFFLNFSTPDNPGFPKVAENLQHIPDIFTFVLVFLGSPLAFEQFNLAIYFSLLLSFISISSIIYLHISDKAELKTLHPWIVIAVYTIFVGAITAVARLELGVTYALASRYITSSSIFTISTLIIGFKGIQTYFNGQQKIPIEWVVVIAITVLTLSFTYYQTFIQGVEKFKVRRSYVDLVAAQLRTVDNIDNISDQYLWILCADTKSVRDGLNILRPIGFIHP